MYLPDNQEEYVPEWGMHNFSIQGLSDALMALESEVTVVQPQSEEYALMLEVTMVDCPRCPCPPTFSWNVEMVMHVLKGDPTLRDLKHVQMDGPGTAYLYFFTSRATEDLSMMPLRLSECMWQRCFLSGFPLLPILPSFPSHWWRAGIGQWLLQKDAGRGTGWSTKTALCTT